MLFEKALELKQEISFFIKNRSCFKELKKASFHLRKKEKKKPIIVKKNKNFEQLSSLQFKKEFDVEYLPNLHFSDISLLKKIVLICKKGISFGSIAEKEIWLGTYYEKEILNGYTPNLYIKWIDYFKEYGLFSFRDLKKNTYVGEYTGIVRKHKRKLDHKNGYCFEYYLGDMKNFSFTIDAKYMGNYLRFINHSKDPNLSLYPAYCNGIMHIIMLTNRFIPKGGELTYDYGPNYWKKREDPK